MTNHPDYDALLERYRELQKRVTRFSSVEQDLINTRDRLDQELISYKRLHAFTEHALDEMSQADFLDLVVESIVDVFEVEGAIVMYHNLKDNSCQLRTEAIDASVLADGSLELALLDWSKGREMDKVVVVGQMDFTGHPAFRKFSRAMMAQFEDRRLGFSVLIMGVIGLEFDAIYPAFSNKNQTMFGIFLKQLESFYINRIRNEELKKANAELDSFVYSVSHDLRAPLLSIQGIVDLISSTDGLPEETHAYLAMANTAVQRLDGNIKEILEYSRNSRLKVKPEDFDVVAMVREIFDSLRFSVSGNIQLMVLPDQPFMISADRARIKVVLNNIISNSVKYRRKDIEMPYVRVTVDQSKTDYIFKIEDNGEGIPRQSREKVFDMFYRASTTTSGTGLGLYITKEIITKLNGAIGLESEEGKGTKVTVRIPLRFIANEIAVAQENKS